MTTHRCTACGAALAPGASWCTLCYAEQRAEPAPAPSEPLSPWVAVSVPVDAVPAAPLAASVAWQVDPLTAPLVPPPDVPVSMPSSAVAVAEPLAAALAEPLAEPPAAPVAEPLAGPAVERDSAPTWPCLECGTRMQMSLDLCTNCGRPFLPGAGGGSVTLPGIGDVRQMDKTQQFVLIAGGLVVIMLVLVVLGFAAGSLL